MIQEQLICDFDREGQEDDFGLQNMNLLEVNNKEKKFTKMASHEPTSYWNKNKNDLEQNNNNNDNKQNNNENIKGKHQKLKKTLTSSSSIDQTQFLNGNLVFIKSGLFSNFTTPQKCNFKEQKISFISPIFSREGTITQQSKKINTESEKYQEERLEDSTNEKIQANHSSADSLSPRSNLAVDSITNEKQQFKQIQQFSSEKTESIDKEVQSSDNHYNDKTHQKAFHKSRFSRKLVSESTFKKKTSFSHPDLEEQYNNDEKKQPNSLREIKPQTSKTIIQSQQQLSNQDVEINSLPQNQQTNQNQQQHSGLTPAQRRRSQLQQVETNFFRDLKSKNKLDQKSQGQGSINIPFSPADKFKIIGTVARTLSRLQVNQVSRIESSVNFFSPQQTLIQIFIEEI